MGGPALFGRRAGARPLGSADEYAYPPEKTFELRLETKHTGGQTKKKQKRSEKVKKENGGIKMLKDVVIAEK